MFRSLSVLGSRVFSSPHIKKIGILSSTIAFGSIVASCAVSKIHTNISNVASGTDHKNSKDLNGNESSRIGQDSKTMMQEITTFYQHVPKGYVLVKVTRNNQYDQFPTWRNEYTPYNFIILAPSLELAQFYFHHTDKLFVKVEPVTTIPLYSAKVDMNSILIKLCNEYGVVVTRNNQESTKQNVDVKNNLSIESDTTLKLWLIQNSYRPFSWAHGVWSNDYHPKSSLLLATAADIQIYRNRHRNTNDIVDGQVLRRIEMKDILPVIETQRALTQSSVDYYQKRISETEKEVLHLTSL